MIFNLELFLDAASNLWLEKQRSALALLGIIIGTASIVTMLGIGSMADHELLRNFEKMGINVFVIQRDTRIPGRSATAQSDGIDEVTIATVPANVGAVKLISPLKTGSIRIFARKRELEFPIAGVWPSIEDISGLGINRGRFLSSIDRDSFVAVLGSGAARELEEAGRPSPVGSSIHLGHYIFTVIGILNEAPTNTFTPIDFNTSVIIPIGISNRVLGRGPPGAAMGTMRSGSEWPRVNEAISSVFTRENPDAPVRIQGARALIDGLRSQRALQTRMFVALAAVSLFVGGIGVMNVMIMSVMERSREIGLRAAIGATPATIRLSFLIEAGILTGLGGIGGAAIGVLLAFGIGLHSNWLFQLPVYAIPFSLCLAVLTGMVFGVVPALKASRLDPMQALRAE